MERLWVGICIFLTFVSWALSDEVVLLQTPDCDKCVWTWYTYQLSLPGWHYPTGLRNRYTLCNGGTGQQPNRWLRSRIIPVGDIQRLDVTVKYSSSKCDLPFIFCNESFFAYVWESNTSVLMDKIPHPINSFGSYRIFATINRPLTDPTVLTIPLEVKSKFIVLGFRDQGGCRILFSVKVSYTICPRKIIEDRLFSLPQTLTALSIMKAIPVNGSCATDSVQAVQGSMIVLCESTGEWNTSLLEGRCVCKENMENKEGICQDCPDGKYYDQKELTCTDCSDGKYYDQKELTCTGLPSAPRNTSVVFLNQSAAVIGWKPPQNMTKSNHVFYEVFCRKPCNGEERICIEEECPNSVSFIPSARLNETQVIVTNLSTYVNYTFKIYTKNRVSDLAKRKHGVDGNFATITLLTMGTVPGKPELSVEQDEATVYVSWTLEDKNGIIKNYNVMYIRDDDSADMMNLTTKKMKQNFEDLRAGKTYEFQVYAVNNYGKGPPDVKKFTVRDALHGGTADKLIVPVTAGVGGALLFIILVVIIIVVFMLRRRKRNVEKDYMRSIEHGGELDQRRYIDPSNYSDLTDILSTFTAEMERSKVKLEGIIGQGEFADVYKGTLKTQGSKDVVAVKVLRPGSSEKSQRDFLSEASIVAQFNHPNVIGLVGVVTKTTPMMILTEFLESGSLDSFLKMRDGQLTNLQLVGMARGVACGMVYLSEKNFIHRDLAARNILVGENMSCKVSDFGLSRELANDNPDSEYETQGGKIPVRWTAPEALQHRTFSSASDVWSYGILLWEIMSFSDRPYWDWNNRDVIDRVTTGYRLPPPEGCPKVVHKLMMECWESDKNTRPTFAEIVCHLTEIIRSPDSLHARSSHHGTSFVKKDAQGFESVKEWLISINMENYVEVFKAANIDSIEKVVKLEESDLREMGVKLIGHRNKMNKSIKSKRAQFANEGMDDGEAAV